MEKSNLTDFQKFDTTVRTVLSVSREEIQRREQEWKRKREKKKRAKTSARASSSKA